MRTPAQPRRTACAVSRTASVSEQAPVPGRRRSAGTPSSRMASSRLSRSSTESEFASLVVPKGASAAHPCARSQRQCRASRRASGERSAWKGVNTGARTPRRRRASVRLEVLSLIMTPSLRKASISASPMPRTSPSTSPRVLAEERRRSVAHRRPGQAHGRGDHRHLPGERMRHLDAEAAGPDVRVLEHLREVVDRAAGHARRLERANPVPRWPAGEERLEDGDERRAVLDARGVGGEARVGRELGPPRHLAQAGELAVVPHRDDQVPVSAWRRPGTARCSACAFPSRAARDR